jgi:hypothetical protein
MTMKWYILNRDGSPMSEHDLPARPADARDDGGDAFTPWRKQREHLHVEDGRISGIHAKGVLEAVRERLEALLEYEALLLKETGGHDDIVLEEADRIIAAR